MNNLIIRFCAVLFLIGIPSICVQAIPACADQPESTSTTNQQDADPDAARLMQQAHDARYQWKDFHGFTADIRVTTDGRSHAGKIAVTPDCNFRLELAEQAQHPWLETKLNSVIGHRRSSEEEEFDVHFVDDQEMPGVGRLIARNDGSGTYRIADGRIAEVHRKSERNWFEITNVEVYPVGGGQYLPTFTSVTYRDPRTGDLTENRTNQFKWISVGEYLLPESCFTVATSSGGARTVQILQFSNHSLRADDWTELQDAASLTSVIGISSEPRLHRPLPEALTSFGATVLGEYLYVFSGHGEHAHGFGKDLLVNHFRRIRFDDPTADWEELAMHESAQSPGLVNDGQHIYRIAGLSFRNSGQDDATDFESTSYFARYDVEQNQWTELAPLPEPRSSLDAAILGRAIYVAGGWNLQGASSSEAPWHDDLLKFDLDQPELGWQVLPGPGYDIRAISLAAHDDKIFLIGGIQSRGVSRKVSIFDPAENTWSEGPELPADSSTAGFATGSFAVGGHLYVTGGSGVLYRLSDEGTAWETADRLFFPRNFLRLLLIGDDRLIAVGGTGVSGGGRSPVIESLRVDPELSPAAKMVSWTIPYEGRAKHSQALLMRGHKLYVFGGNASWAAHDFSKEAFVDEAFVFDLAQQKVTPLASSPMAFQSAATVLNRQTSEHQTIAVMGGLGIVDDKFGALDQILHFDSESNRWTTADQTLPRPRSMFDATIHDDAIWMFGGSGAGHNSGLDRSIVHWWGDDSAAAALPDSELPHGRRSFGGAILDGHYYAVGGLGAGNKIVNEVDVFNFETRQWKTAANPKAARVFPSVCSAGSKLYLFGGFSSGDEHFAECTSLEVYDPAVNSWKIVTDAIEGVDASMRMLNMNGRLLFFGIDRDTSEYAKFVLYDPEPQATPPVVESMTFGGRRVVNEAEANAKLMMRSDANKDGKLSAEELGSRLAAFILAADTDGDQLASFSEVKAKLEAEAAAAAAVTEEKATKD